MSPPPDLQSQGESELKSNSKLYCSMVGCVYSYAYGSDRFFTKKRFLNQHVMKVHAEKKYSCTKCQKKFGTEWLLKSHEKSCGVIWSCSCGHKYGLRESLLTHVRRNSHELADDVRYQGKKYVPKVQKKPEHQPLIVIVQPVVSQVPYVPPALPGCVNKRLILPKQPEPKYSYPLFIPVILSQSVDAVAKCDPRGNQSNEPVNDGSSDILQSQNFAPLQKIKTVKESVKANLEQKQRHKTAVETQTCSDLTAAGNNRCRQRKLESRGSQCSGRMRTKKVRIESTHTQTIQSAVVKMKRKGMGNRSRRRSVAVLTDADLPQATQELWCDFENFMFTGEGNKDWLQNNKFSTSTQTACGHGFDSFKKVLCDSETITDNDSFQFSWSADRTPQLTDSNYEVQNLNEQNKKVSPLVISSSDIPEDFYAEPHSLSQVKTSTCEKDVFSTPEMQTVGTSSKDLGFSSVNSDIHESSLLASILDESAVVHSPLSEQKDINSSENEVFSQCTTDSSSNNEELAMLDFMFENVIRGKDGDRKEQIPVLSDIQTQTNASDSILDYDMIFDLANMETQTTEEFLFSDLEFLDTETQTPWDDLPNIDDGGLPVDHLSIEIQTDCFPLGYQKTSGKIVRGKHMETQTHSVEGPRFTHSEAQTCLLHNL